MYGESGAKMLQSHCYLLVQGQQFIKKGLVERINEKLVAENQVFFLSRMTEGFSIFTFRRTLESNNILHIQGICYARFQSFHSVRESGRECLKPAKKKKNQTQNAGNCSPEACFLLIRQLFKKKSQFQSQCFSKWIVFINLVNWLSSR